VQPPIRHASAGPSGEPLGECRRGGSPTPEDVDDLDAAPPSHWRIEWTTSGDGDSTTTRLDDKGRLTRHHHRQGSSDQLLQAFPTEVIKARDLLTELQRRGQLWPASSSPPAPPYFGVRTDIRVTLDGVEYFVNLTANDPRDLAPPLTWRGAGTHDDWPNHRADRLIFFLSFIGQPHLGELNVHGALGLEVVKPGVGAVQGELFPTCYFQSIDAGAPHLPGTITVQFVIDYSGTVSTVNHEAPSKATDEHDAKIIACVVKQFKDVFKDMTFPKPADGAPVYVSCQVLFGP